MPRRPRPTALVTGAGGFVGMHLASRLAADGCRVAGFGNFPEPLHPEGLTDYTQGDVADYPAVARAIRRARPDWIFHLAGITGGSRRIVYATNHRGTVNVLEAMLAERPSASAVVMGTAAEYGAVPRSLLPITEAQPCRPLTPYGASKHAATRAAQRLARRGVRVVVARPFNLIGAFMPPSLLLGRVMEQLRRARENAERPARILVGPTGARRDFVTVDDVTDALVRMVRGPFWGEVFNLCSGRATAIGALLTSVARSAPWPVKFTRDRTARVGRGVSVSYGSCAKAAAAFGFAPDTDLERAVRRICRLELGAVARR
jgi:GDP-4-dehydro-6-deoxy-D-mannose reductase